MKCLAESSRIVESKEIDDATYEVCAIATADFDEDGSILVLNLHSFVRKVNQQGPDAVTHPAWLPRSEIIREHMARDEAADQARELFERWARKVREAIPARNDFKASVCVPAGARMHQSH